MRKKWLVIIGIILVFYIACVPSAQNKTDIPSTQNKTGVPKSIIIKNMDELSGSVIGLYVFEELPQDGQNYALNTAVQKSSIDTTGTITVDLIVPTRDFYKIYSEDIRFDKWTGTGEYYVAIYKRRNNLDNYPKIKDTYILMDENNTPVKVSIMTAYTTLDFMDFKMGTEFYRMDLASMYDDDILYAYERDPLYVKDYYYENDLLIDVLYDGNVSVLNKLIEPNMLIHFTSAELRLLRNMIFAKYNYLFQSEDLRNYFTKFSWYNGTESSVQNNMTPIDWQNLDIIQDYERRFDGYAESSNLGERFTFVGQIATFEYPDRDLLYELHWSVVKKIKVDGEITVTAGNFDKVEIARAKVVDSQFQMEFGEISHDLLTRWDWVFYHPEQMESSDPELKISFIWFELSGTYIEHGIEQQFVSDDFLEVGKGANDFYYYLYSDRDATIQGHSKGEAFFNGLHSLYPKAEFNTKRVCSISLKKGWNKIKHYIFYNGKYIIQKTISSPENGFYGFAVW